MNIVVPELDPNIQNEMPSLVDQSWGIQVSSVGGLEKPWMKPANEVTSTSSCSTLFGVPISGNTGAGGVAGLDNTTLLPAPANVQKPSGSPPGGHGVAGRIPILKIVDDGGRFSPGLARPA